MRNAPDRCPPRGGSQGIVFSSASRKRAACGEATAAAMDSPRGFLTRWNNDDGVASGGALGAGASGCARAAGVSGRAGVAGGARVTGRACRARAAGCAGVARGTRAASRASVARGAGIARVAGAAGGAGVAGLTLWTGRAGWRRDATRQRGRYSCGQKQF